MFNSIYSSSSSFESDLGVPSHYEIQNGASPRCFDGFLDDAYDSEDGSWGASIACAFDPTPTNEKATFDLRGAWGVARDVKISPKAPSKTSPTDSDGSEDTISDYFSRLLVSSSSSFSSDDDDSFDSAPLSDPYEDLDDDIFDPRTLYESAPKSLGQETLEHAGTTYTIHGVLGSGSFGEVVYALSSTGDQVAIKICPKASPGILPSVLYDIVMNERDILVKTASGDNPFLTQPLACFQDADNVYFVMRLYSLNLAQLVFPIEAPSLPPQQIKLFAAELLLGLASLHKMGIVHRDLKPDNVLVTPKGHLAIADFGLSKQFFAGRVRPEMKMFERWGTDGYLAPEVLAETCFTEGYTGAVDIWGYGIMLYEMLLGRRSVTANTPEGQIFMNTQLADVIHADIDRRVDEVAADLLHTILQANPSQRPSWKIIRNHEYFADVDWEAVKARDSQADAPTVSLALDLEALQPYCSRATTGLKFKVQDCELNFESDRLCTAQSDIIHGKAQCL